MQQGPFPGAFRTEPVERGGCRTWATWRGAVTRARRLWAPMLETACAVGITSRWASMRADTWAPAPAPQPRASQVFTYAHPVAVCAPSVFDTRCPAYGAAPRLRARCVGRPVSNRELPAGILHLAPPPQRWPLTRDPSWTWRSGRTWLPTVLGSAPLEHSQRFFDFVKWLRGDQRKGCVGQTVAATAYDVHTHVGLLAVASLGLEDQRRQLRTAHVGPDRRGF